MIADDQLQEMLARLDPTTRTLVAEVDLGGECAEFLDSQVGRYLVGCAQQEILAANEALASVSPWRRRRIQELQNRRWRAESLLIWLRDLLLSGKAAVGVLSETGE